MGRSTRRSRPKQETEFPSCIRWRSLRSSLATSALPAEVRHFRAPDQADTADLHRLRRIIRRGRVSQEAGKRTDPVSRDSGRFSACPSSADDARDVDSRPIRGMVSRSPSVCGSLASLSQVWG